MAIPLTIRSINDQIYSYQLSSAYKSPWVYEPSYALAREADIWEIVRNEAGMQSAIDRAINAVVRPWRVEPSKHAGSSFNPDTKEVSDNSKKLASICNEGLDNLREFNKSRKWIAQARFLGRTYGVIGWENRFCSLDGAPPMMWKLPTKIKPVDRRRFRWTTDLAEGNLQSHRKVSLEMFSLSSNMWEKVPRQLRRSMVEYIYEDTEDRLGYGRGLLEALFFLHYFKTGTFKKIVEGIDRYANGVWVGKLDSLRQANTDKTNEDLITAMETVFQKMRSEHAAILGDNDEIEIVEPSGKGFDMSLEFVRYLDEQAERLCNGSVRPAGHSVDGTGSKAASSEEAETTEAFHQDYREELDEVYDRDLLGAFLYHNNENFNKLGLGDPTKVKRPKFTSEQIKRQDPTEALGVISGVHAMGLPILKAEIYDRVELTQPDPENDDVLEGADPMMGMGDDGPFGSGPSNTPTETGKPDSQTAKEKSPKGSDSGLDSKDSKK